MIKRSLQVIREAAQSFSVLALIPLASGAAPLRPDEVSTVSDVKNIIGNVAEALAVILFALAAIFIIISAIFYLTAAGNPEQLKRAKDTLIYAIVGIVLGLVAFGVADLVENFLTG